MPDRVGHDTSKNNVPVGHDRQVRSLSSLSSVIREGERKRGCNVNFCMSIHPANLTIHFCFKKPLGQLSPKSFQQFINSRSIIDFSQTCHTGAIHYCATQVSLWHIAVWHVCEPGLWGLQTSLRQLHIPFATFSTTRFLAAMPGWT